MALRALMIGKKLESKRAELEGLRSKETEFEKREAELEEALKEAQTEEETDEVGVEAEKFDKEKEEYEATKAKLVEEIEGLEKELEEERSKSPIDAGNKKTPSKVRNEGREMEIRSGIFKGMTTETRNEFVAAPEMKEFLTQVRSMVATKRSVSGAELTIPTLALEILRNNLDRYSKLLSYVRVKKVKGKARQTISGTVPEGIWTEAVGKLNELSFTFNQVELDGYKVGGYIPIPNSTLEDSDINLATEILEALAQAIGYAVDKAILYGTGVKMPLGVVTRLNQAVQPDNWGSHNKPWTNLVTSNILKLSLLAKTGAEFFADLIVNLGKAKEDYSDGKKFWCMNSTTKTTIMSKAIAFNAAAALTSSVNDEMPVIGGKIITLPFMSDNEIVGGYGSLYTLAEREGGQFAQSEHAMFIEDQTVFKGTARYDGTPVIGEGFVAINFGNVAVATSKTFAADAANTVSGA